MDYEKMYFPKVEMSQTVPTGNYNAQQDPYAVYADSFDLSLLPSNDDGEVPLSPQSELSSSQLSLVSLDYIPATIYHEQSIKTEKPWNQEENNNNSNNNNNNNTVVSQPPPPPLSILQPQSVDQSPTDTSILLQQLQKQYQFYPSPLPSPPQDYPVSGAVVYPPSPCPSIENNFQIKQEFHILPPSPPESSGAPSPCSDIKSEPETDTETLIDINSLLDKSVTSYGNQQKHHQQYQYKSPSSSSTSSPVSISSIQSKNPPQDHQLLREYLQDTSFQKKHNLKPLALESLIGGLDVRSDIEPVISLALEHAKRDAEATCAVLKISQDPQQWTTSQVHAWIRSTIEQFKLPQIDDIEIKFPEDGAAFVCLTEEEFHQRVPEAGGTIHAQLEIWKLACNTPEMYQSSDVMIQSIGLTTNIWNSSDCQQNMDISEDEDEDMIPTSAAVHGTGIPVAASNTCLTNTSIISSITVNGINGGPVTISPSSSSSLSSSSSSSITKTTTIPSSSSSSTISSTSTTSGNPLLVGTTSTATPSASVAQIIPTTAKSGSRPGGSHIHLWQFLKELLASPQLHGTAIRWLDRNKGVFKIEDSVRVAKLWGRRKNRPAMNYDKLSRSIRQYYKKGIMKKTERSQRLVYQFCHPYCL